MASQEKIDRYNAPFPTNLRNLLDERKTTITALARSLGITRQAVSQYADGTGQPNAEKLCMIADYFDVSVDWLLGRTDTPVINVDIRSACATTGLSADSVFFLEGLKNKNSERSKDALTAINILLSERNGDECSEFWKHLAEYFFTEDKPFSSPLKYGVQKFEAEEILSAFLARNNALLRKIRERLLREKEEKANGKH